MKETSSLAVAACLGFVVCLAFAPWLAAQTATQPARPTPTPPARPTPTQTPPATPATPPGTPAPAPGAAASAPTPVAPPNSPPNSPTPVVLNTCDYVDPQVAAALLGRDASATTAPSRGALLTCGYTSPSGDALTVWIA